MSNYSAENLLQSWQDRWGMLDEKWIKDFLSHSAIPQILYYPNEWIEIAILHRKKLSEILVYLQSNENEIETKEYIPIVVESEESLNNVTRSIGKQPTIRIPDHDWWRDPK